MKSASKQADLVSAWIRLRLQKEKEKSLCPLFCGFLHGPLLRISMGFCVQRFFTMQERCRVWRWLNEFSGVVLSCFSLTGFADVSLIKPEDSFNPLFKAGSVFSVMGQETGSSY